jgi:glycosyltransferase involved in cell wall biosynthesis
MIPLVSVGIPTYNRAEGLKNALLSITTQTYQNLQIIVADNCSEDENVKLVVEEFTKKDPRIIYFRHNENRGPVYNFRFVLDKAEGDYFVWAADDDDRSPYFIEELLSVIGDHSAAFCNYAVRYGENSRVDHIKIFGSGKGSSKYEQAKNFLKERIPSMIYGLYKTKDIFWFSNMDKTFDWFDCFAIFKIILLFNGFAFSERELYTAGVIGARYEYKPMNPSDKRIFSYSPYFKNSTKVIFQSDIKLLQKLKLLVYLAEVNFRSFLAIEKDRKSYKLYSFLYRIYNRLRPAIYLRKI